MSNGLVCPASPETGEVPPEARRQMANHPQRSADGRLMYFEHQLQRSADYSGPLDDLSIEEVRELLAQAIDYFGLGYWDETPLPPAGLPGKLHNKYDWGSPEGEAILLGIDYIGAIVANERRTMHNVWESARRLIRQLEEKNELRVLGDVAKGWGEKLDERLARPQSVYFIGSASGPVKIGIAADPKSRLSGLQTGHHDKLELLAVCEGGMAREREYHQRFADCRLHGEWFARVPEILAEIDRLNAGEPA